MKTISNKLLFLLAATLTTGCKTDTLTPDKALALEQLKDSISRELHQSFEKNELVGLSVKLITNDTSTFEYHEGLARVEDQTPVSASSVFRIASISKTFTAIALLQLQEAGRVDLNTDVSEYLGWRLRNPKYPKQPITLHMLLSHTSSIRDGKGYGQFTSTMFREPLHIKTLFARDGAYYTDDMFADHQPGAYFSYTNCTWGLIATVIERISGMTLEEYCIANIFTPMEMDARFDPANLENFKDLGVLYRFKNDAWAGQSDLYNGIKPAPKTGSDYTPGTNGLLYGPQGGLRCSVNDLEKVARLFWNEGLYKNKQILLPETLELMASDHWTFRKENGDTWDDFFRSYGYGLHRITAAKNKDVIFPEMEMAGHPGIAYGLLSDLYFDKDSKTAVIFITNGSKKDYEYGTESTFYQPEEDVFKALTTLLTQ